MFIGNLTDEDLKTYLKSTAIILKAKDITYVDSNLIGFYDLQKIWGRFIYWTNGDASQAKYLEGYQVTPDFEKIYYCNNTVRFLNNSRIYVKGGSVSIYTSPEKPLSKTDMTKEFSSVTGIKLVSLSHKYVLFENEGSTEVVLSYLTLKEEV